MRRRVTRRRGWRRFAVVTGIAFLLVVATAPPASGAPGELRVVAVDSSNHPEVTLTVEPPEVFSGTTLPPDAFAVVENGTPVAVDVAKIGTAGTEPRHGLEVVMVIDTSGSMRGEPMAAARDAATAFISSMPEGTRSALVEFGTTPVLVNPLSSDRAATLGAIGTLDAVGETALYDALLVGLDQFSGDAVARRALVVLTDGGDTSSIATLQTASEALSASSVEFAAVELVTPEYEGTGIRVLAESASGVVLSTDQPHELASRYEYLAADLTNRYLVTYTTALGGATEIALTITWEGTTASATREIRLAPMAASSGAVAPAPEAVVQPAPGLLGSRAALFTGLAMLVAAFSLLAAWMVFRSPDARVVLTSRFGRVQAMSRRGGAVAQIAERATRATQKRLEASERSARLDGALERAGLDLRGGEFVLLAGIAGLVALAAGVLSSGLLMGLAFALLAMAAFPLGLRHLERRRSSRFAEQLPDTLQLITGNLRAGHSILQAMDAVANDAPSPTREEFQRLVVETRIGRDLPDALRAMQRRIGNQDFEWFIQALAIHREVGGDLAEILETVATTIRDRTHLRRQVKTLSAEGRLSAVILFVLPIAVGVLVTLINPGYLNELFATAPGMALLTTAVVLMTGGFFWLRRLVRLDL